MSCVHIKFINLYIYTYLRALPCYMHLKLFDVNNVKYGIPLLIQYDHTKYIKKHYMVSLYPIYNIICI